MLLFEENIENIYFMKENDIRSNKIELRSTIIDDWERDYYSMIFGLRKHVRKIGFNVLTGLFRGVDSTIITALAVYAFG